jgi:hypothetical protein
MSGLGKVQVPWPERLAMLTRSNFEMSSWGLSRTGGQSTTVVGQPDDRLAFGSLVSSVPKGLRLAVEAGGRGQQQVVRMGERSVIAGCAVCSVLRR